MTRTSRHIGRAAFALLVIALAACDKSSSGGAASTQSIYAQADGADNLKGLIAKLAELHGKGDFKNGAALTKGILTDEASAKKAFKDDAPKELIVASTGNNSQLPSDDARVAALLVPGEGRTEIRVHGATTEEIIAYQQGTPAFNEFPGGARKVAEAGLRPGVTFYEVEIVEPGKDSGMKYHLFFWNGSQWKMLGAVWRALPPQ